MVAGDEIGAWAVIEDALTAGALPADIHLTLLIPCLASIGSRWESGELSIAEEHRATGVAQRLVGRMGPRFARRGRKRGAVVLGAVEGELHALPNAMLADLVRGIGFEVIDLGASTPPESFVEIAQATPRLFAVMVGATTPGREPALTPRACARCGTRRLAHRSSSAVRWSATRSTPARSGPTGGRGPTARRPSTRSKTSRCECADDRVEGDAAGEGPVRPAHRRDRAPGLPHPVPAGVARRAHHVVRRCHRAPDRAGARLQHRRPAQPAEQLDHARARRAGAQRRRGRRRRSHRTEHLQRARRRRDHRGGGHRLRAARARRAAGTGGGSLPDRRRRGRRQRDRRIGGLRHR